MKLFLPLLDTMMSVLKSLLMEDESHTRKLSKGLYLFTCYKLSLGVTMEHGAVIALYFEKTGHFLMVVGSEVQIQ